MQKNSDYRLSSSKASSFSGTAKVPGDKSISHRALMFSALAIGKSRISGLLEGEDVLNTAEALRQMGVKVTKQGEGEWEVQGVGTAGLSEPDNVLEMGNSGTSTRLLMGLVSSFPYSFTFSGDASLSKRPMGRVITPLSQMGAAFHAREGGKLPITVKGAKNPMPIEYRLPVASAQVKSAILLAGLNALGKTTVIEEKPTRDHTERMLLGMGAEISVKKLEDGADAISITGYPDLKPQDLAVPADPSSAAFIAVAALLVEGAEVLIPNVCMNETRIGLFTTLKEMGANIAYENKRKAGGEEVADIRVKYSKLKGVSVPAERAPSMIDEYPVLAMAAAVAEGVTRMEGVEELRVKESDRLAAVEAGLKANGVQVTSGEDWMEVTGGPVEGGGEVVTYLDHRIAMSFLVLGLAAKKPIMVDDGRVMETSFPGFVVLMNQLGAKIK